MPDVNSDTFCCSAGEGIRLDAVRPEYQTPMSFQVPVVFARRF